MIKKSVPTWFYFLGAAACVLLFADAGFAQGAQLGQKVDNVTSNIISIAKVAGIGIAVIGFIFAGIKYTAGDPDAKSRAVQVTIGACLIGLAPWIVDALLSWTS